MRESELHSMIYERSIGMSDRFPHVLLGPGDDCAVLAPTSSPLVVTVDQLIEGRHVLSHGRTPIDLIARKAITRSVSDIAAMGARPLWSLATAALPSGFPHANALFDSMSRWASHWQAPLVGGDTAFMGADAPFVLTVTMAGTIPDNQHPILRSGAQVGDELWVTGQIGNSFHSGRHLTFEPRLTQSEWLVRVLGKSLHAMIDISDGLGRDTTRLASASGVHIDIQAGRLPLHSDASDPKAAASDGEDYELVFAVAPNSLSAILRGDSTDFNTPAQCSLTRIGRVVEGEGCCLILNGVHLDASTLGWDHS